MKKSHTRSVVGKIFDFGLTLYLGIGLGISVAVMLYLVGLGQTIIPGWVGYVCSPLAGLAFCIAVVKSDWRGIFVGTVIAVASLLVLGLSEAIGMPELSRTNPYDFAHAAVGITEIIATGFPLLACIFAIVIPLLDVEK